MGVDAPANGPALLAGAMHLACGVLVFALAFVAPPASGNRAGVVSVALAAIAMAVVLVALPWHRWPRRASLVMVPEALVLVVAFDLAAGDALLYPLFFVVIWAWVGLTQRPGDAVRLAPLLAIAYLLPSGAVAGPVAASALYAVPVCVLIGEAIALVAQRLRDAERQRAADGARYAALVRHASEFVTVLSEDGVIQFASPASEALLGRRPEELVGTSAADLIHPDDLASELREAFRDALDGAAHRAVEYRVRGGDGQWRWVEGTITSLLDEPAIAGLVVNVREISERKEAEARLAWTAFHDPLTTLPNRASLVSSLDRRIALGQPVALLFLDLDGFKVVNDSLGHSVGDALLVDVAARLRRTLPLQCPLARLGGDEFVAVVPPHLTHDASALALRIVDSLHVPFTIGDRQIVVGASVGVAHRDDGCTPQELLRRADLAMYEAKQRGRGRFEVFDADLARRARRRLDVEAQLRTALERDELVVHYQPEIDLETGAIVGAEALVRWDHPTRGIIGPGEFMDVAEASGLVTALDERTITTAVVQLAAWRSTGAELSLSVNVSAEHVRREQFVDWLAERLHAAALPPAALRIEITEGALLEPEVADAVLPQLRELGVGLAVDDFGTGYSSLAYLQRLPLQTLKIDRSFLEPVVTEGVGSPIVAAVIAMGHSLDLTVVAEGVETPAHVALLRHLGCDHAQGFLFARPLDPDRFEALLRAPVIATGHRQLADDCLHPYNR